MATQLISLLYAVLAAGLLYLLWQGVVLYQDHRRRLWQLRNIFCGPYNWLFGHLLLFPGPTEEGLAFLRSIGALNPRMGLTRLGPFHYAIAATHPEILQTIFKSSAAAAKANAFVGYKSAKCWLGDGLIVSKGKKWARNRRLLTPAFHFDILKPYITVKNKAVDILLDKMADLCQDGQYIEIFSHMSLCALDIILRCAFSYENDCQLEGGHHPYVKAVNELGSAMVYRLLSPWLYPDFIYFLTPEGRTFKRNCDYVHSVADGVISNRRTSLENSPDTLNKNRKYLDFLDVLLTAKDDNGVGMTDLEIREEVDTFLFAGHDTTTSGMSWTLYSLAAYPEFQRKCQQEIDEILAGREDDTILWDDLGKLKYLTMCIKESLRLHTTVPFIERETTADLEIDGNVIPKGTTFDLHLYVNHHNPVVWENSMEYIPDRFLPENVAKRHPFAFVPFSAGSRNCIGQNFAMHEMKIIIARILRRFNLELDPNNLPQHLLSIVMKAENGIMMRTVPRSTT